MTDRVPRPRLRRRRVALGWSQEKAAEEVSKRYPHIGIDARQIGRWETGTTATPRLVNIWAVSQTYGVPPEELDFPPLAAIDFASFEAPSGSPAVQSGGARGATVADTAERIDIQPPEDHVDSDDVKRRAFARLLALAGMAAGSLDLERLSTVLAGTRADEAALNDLETLTGDLIRREATLAPDSLLPAVRGHLHGLRDVLVWTPSSLAPRAHSLAGQTALLAGYLVFKLERKEEADVYWSLANRFGDMAGDLRLQAAVLVLQAMRRQEDDDLPQNLVLLNRAASLLGQDPDAALAAHVLTYRASAHAEASQAASVHSTNAMRDIEAVQSHLSRMYLADSSIYVAESVRGEAIQERAVSLLHLDRAREAAAELEGLLATIDHASHSWRADIVTELAWAHAKMGDSEHACELLGTSLQLAACASAPRSVKKIRTARARWLADYDGPAVRRLDERIQTSSA